MAAPQIAGIRYSQDAKIKLGKNRPFSAIEMINEAVNESFAGNPITAELIEKAAAALRRQWIGEQNGS